MEIVWDKLTRRQWEALADRAEAPMQQRWRYGEVHASLGGQVHRAVVYRHGQPLALCQCLGRRLAPGLAGGLGLSLASNGPLLLPGPAKTPAETPAETPAQVPARVLALIRQSQPLARPRLQFFTPAQAQIRAWRFLPLISPATSARLALPVARHSLHGKWRNALKKAEKQGLTVSAGRCTGADLKTLLAQDGAAQKARGYRALPAAFSLTWHRLAADDLLICTARHGRRAVSRALFICHGNTATYHVAASTPHGRRLSAQRLVLWHGFQALARRGVTGLDLGLIDTVNSPGLARFKLGTGARAAAGGPTMLAL